MKIYVASSWRNQKQQEIVKILRKHNHKVYDFKNPNKKCRGFHWSDIDKNWKSWTPQEYRTQLSHPLSIEGFKSDFEAMQWADVIIGVQPFGRSASLEIGWGVGAEKITILLLDNGEPELMVKMIDFICCDMQEVLQILKDLDVINKS